MQNLSDEDIDKLFKRAAEKQQTQFDPADWDNMASRLDANKRPWLNYYTGIGSIVLLGVVIWLGWFISRPTVVELSASVSSSISKEATSMTDNSVDAVKTSSLIPNAQSSSNEKMDNVGESETASDEIGSAMTNPKIVDKVRYTDERSGGPKLARDKSSSVASSGSGDVSQALPLPVSTNQSNQTGPGNEFRPSTKPDTRINSKTSEVLKNNNNTLVDYNLNEHQTNTTVATAETTVVIADKESILNKEQMDAGVKLTPEQNSNQHTSIRNDQTSSLIVIDSVEKITDEHESVLENKNLREDLADSTLKQSTFSRIAIRATIAPDFSSEQFNSVDKMGFNYGLVIEYFLSKNISVATGALWSRKYYSAVDVEYNGYHADRAYGDCRMWDIPLNVNYYFTPSKQYSFFASAGFSSYLMNEENYDYEVDTNYGTKTYSSQIKKENNEWFKILNVSVGLQKQINSRFAIQVEPFVKVPLAGVGEGNISLASFGGFFSIRYNFLPSQK